LAKSTDSPYDGLAERNGGRHVGVELRLVRDSEENIANRGCAERVPSLLRWIPVIRSPMRGFVSGDWLRYGSRRRAGRERRLRAHAGVEAGRLRRAASRAFPAAARHKWAKGKIEELKEGIQEANAREA